MTEFSRASSMIADGSPTRSATDTRGPDPAQTSRRREPELACATMALAAFLVAGASVQALAQTACISHFLAERAERKPHGLDSSERAALRRHCDRDGRGGGRLGGGIKAEQRLELVLALIHAHHPLQGSARVS